MRMLYAGSNLEETDDPYYADRRKPFKVEK
jgi:hypothetical protein